MSNVTINRKGQDVELWLDAFIPNYDSRRFGFTFHCGGDVYAGLLTEHLRKRLGNLVEEARREAYEQGWKDAKAKRSKSDWFSRTL